MTIKRIEQGSRMSQAVVHGNTIYLAGQLGEAGADVGSQTRQALEEVDALLAQVGSDKHHILSATIWLADMADFAAMNVEWDRWVAQGATPARATGEARLASPEYKVEIIVTAAVADQV